MDLNLFEMWAEMGILVKGVVLVLTLQAVSGIAVVIDRLVFFTRSRARSRAFAGEARKLLDRFDHQGLLALASRTKGSHLAALIHEGVSTYERRRAAGVPHDKAIELTRRALERKGERSAPT